MRRVGFDAWLVAFNFLLRLPGHRFRLLVLRRLGRVNVGGNCAVERGVTFAARGGVTIGSGTNINRGVHLDGRGGVEIGANVNVSPEAMVISAEHDIRSHDFAGRNRRTVVEDSVWLATRAIVLPGARVGEGAVVGAGAVVRGEVEAWTVVAGNPARRIGERPRGAQADMAVYRRWFH